MKIVEKSPGVYEFRFTVLWPALFALTLLIGTIYRYIFVNDKHCFLGLVTGVLILLTTMIFMTEISVCRINLVKGTILIVRRLLIRMECKEFPITENTCFFLMSQRGYSVICLSPDSITKNRRNALHFIMYNSSEMEKIKNRLNELIGKANVDEQNVSLGLHFHPCLRQKAKPIKFVGNSAASEWKSYGIIRTKDKITNINVIKKSAGVYEFKKNEYSLLLFSLSCLAIVISVYLYLNNNDLTGIVICSLVVLFALLFATEMSVCRIDLIKGTILIKRRQLIRRECKEFPITKDTSFILLSHNGSMGVCLSPDGVTKNRENALYFIFSDSDMHEKIKNRLNEILYNYKDF